MTKRIIVLDQINIPSDKDFNYVMWADVPVSRQSFYANANATSAFKNATVDEITALKSGAIVERTGTLYSQANQTIAQIKTRLITDFNAFQSDVTNNNHWGYYGTYYDGTTWTNVTVA